MRLLITTPTSVVVDDRDVVALRAQDESGSFAILQGQTRRSLLAHRERLLRQEEITTEIVELAAGAEASRAGRRERSAST